MVSVNVSAKFEVHSLIYAFVLQRATFLTPLLGSPNLPMFPWE